MFLESLLYLIGVAQPAPAGHAPPQQPTVTVADARPTATIENLRKAAQGEADAALRYERFARRADEEGYGEVAKLFRAAAESERIHLRNHQAVLRELGEPIPALKPSDERVGTTRENLLVPLEHERAEAADTYPEYARVAARENAPAAARSFAYARDSEAGHLRLFQQALRELGNNPARDYFVQVETGMVTTRAPSGALPVTQAAPRVRRESPG